MAAVEHVVDELARWTPLPLAVVLTVAELFGAVRDRAGRVVAP